MSLTGIEDYQEFYYDDIDIRDNGNNPFIQNKANLPKPLFLD